SGIAPAMLKDNGDASPLTSTTSTEPSIVADSSEFGAIFVRSMVSPATNPVTLAWKSAGSASASVPVASANMIVCVAATLERNSKMPPSPVNATPVPPTLLWASSVPPLAASSVPVLVTASSITRIPPLVASSVPPLVTALPVSITSGWPATLASIVPSTPLTSVRLPSPAPIWPAPVIVKLKLVSTAPEPATPRMWSSLVGDPSSRIVPPGSVSVPSGGTFTVSPVSVTAPLMNSVGSEPPALSSTVPAPMIASLTVSEVPLAIWSVAPETMLRPFAVSAAFTVTRTGDRISTTLSDVGTTLSLQLAAFSQLLSPLATQNTIGVAVGVTGVGVVVVVVVSTTTVMGVGVGVGVVVPLPELATVMVVFPVFSRI